MTTIYHLSLGVADVPAACVFYDRVLDVLGIRCLAGGNGAHVAFAAPDRDAVTKIHAAGLEAGASDEGAPGVRAAYPTPGVFAAYLRDPWGNKIELVHGGFSV